MLLSRGQLTEDNDLDARMQIQQKIAQIQAEIRDTKDGLWQLRQKQQSVVGANRLDCDMLQGQHDRVTKKFKELVEKFAQVVDDHQKRQLQKAEAQKQQQTIIEQEPQSQKIELDPREEALMHAKQAAERMK